MEFVYVVPRRVLFERDTVQGFRSAASPTVPSSAAPELISDYLPAIAKHGFFVERAHAEHDSSLKQVIPYCIIVDGTSLVEEGKLSVLCLRRLGKQGERRLHDKLSIGIGGHINPIDFTINNPSPGKDLNDPTREAIVHNGVLREVTEELELDPKDASTPKLIGVLNDDSTPVGSVHFGLVYAITAPTTTRIREHEHMAGEWRPWRKLVDDERSGANFETWSGFLIRTLRDEQVVEMLQLTNNLVY